MQKTEFHFLVGTVILGFLSIFKKGQESSPYEVLNSVCISRAQRDVRAPVQIRWTPTAFSRVSTRDSDMPSSCEMEDEPELTTAGKSGILLCQGLSDSFPFETESTGSLSHTYC